MLTPPDSVRSRNMAAIKAKDTKPEWLVRRMLHAAGFRYRLHVKDLPGRPDLVFPSRRKVIFVNGCFWHGHDCARGRPKAKTNAKFWSDKIAGNRARDARNAAALKKAGWRVLTIWQCQLNKAGLTARLAKFLDR
jgi:DNA mismatch endonuclease (patch repair protein)